MVSKPNLAIKSYKPSSPQKIFEPELIWPSICPKDYTESDSGRVPQGDLISYRYTAWKTSENFFGSKSFDFEVKSASEVYFVDNHVDADSMTSIVERLSENRFLNKLFILIGSHDKSEVYELFQYLLKELDDNGCKGDFELKQSLDSNKFPYIHDRFALIDGELWHCGATVGGVHPGLNALSRGWNGCENRFLEFFQEIWEKF